jgi:hypothetical protein
MDAEAYRDHSAESVPANPPLAGVGALPVLIQTDNVSCLESLESASTGENSACRRLVVYPSEDGVRAQMVVCEDHLLNAVEPHFSIFAVFAVRGHAGACLQT